MVDSGAGRLRLYERAAPAVQRIVIVLDQTSSDSEERLRFGGGNPATIGHTASRGDFPLPLIPNRVTPVRLARQSATLPIDVRSTRVARTGDSFLMAPSTIERWRAYLLIAALAGMFVQCFVLVSWLALRVPEAFFTTMTFRMWTVVAIVTAILSVRKLARAAFRAALDCGFVHVTGIDRHTVAVSSDCAYRRLVILHIRLNGNRFRYAHG
ncbi:hypothetical protein [Burkholderia cepacia]|uniref:hypothetical protein n=1 Tax=Burkholderia cepacia TaxID=292 RepID=UPI00158991ED|nr:hypothetical protein [Burkholderia cepacia]